MAASMISRRVFYRLSTFQRNPHIPSCFYSSNSSDNPTDKSDTTKPVTNPEVSPLVKAFVKFDEKVKAQEKVKTEEDENRQKEEDGDNESFASMLRRSKLLQLGKIEKSIVTGTIIEVMNDDLYIDFGGKFHCVCTRPQLNPGLYHRGTEVKVLLKDFEMSSAFLGSDKHVTLLEADGVLLGLHKQMNIRYT